MMRRSPLNFQLKKKRASTFYMAVCAIHSFHLKYVYFSSDKIVLISRFSAFTFHSLYFPSRAHFTTFPNFAAHFCSVRLSQPLSCIIDINRVRALAIILPSSEMLRDFFSPFKQIICKGHKERSNHIITAILFKTHAFRTIFALLISTKGKTILLFSFVRCI